MYWIEKKFIFGEHLLGGNVSNSSVAQLVLLLCAKLEICKGFFKNVSNLSVFGCLYLFSVTGVLKCSLVILYLFKCTNFQVRCHKQCEGKREHKKNAGEKLQKKKCK